MKTLYFISGLGADQRVFKNLSLPGFERIHIQWLPPFKDETIASYCLRLSKLITDPDPILIGLSFGGIIAIEISKHIKVQKILLLSSVKADAELPLLYRIAGKTGLQKLIPISVFKLVNPVSFWMFGLTDPEEKNLFRQIVKESDNDFYRWAVNVICIWKHTSPVKNLIHIHGDQDKVLPIPAHVDHVVKDGGHLMVLNRSEEVSDLIQTVLNSVT